MKVGQQSYCVRHTLQDTARSGLRSDLVLDLHSRVARAKQQRNVRPTFATQKLRTHR